MAVSDIAKKLGRTYGSIECLICRLRAEGDLPQVRMDSDTWLSRTLLLLTQEEIDELDATL